MNLLDERFRLERQEDLGSVILYTYVTSTHRKVRRAICFKFLEVTKESVRNYAAAHRKLMEELKDSDSRDFFFLFDLSGICNTNYLSVTPQLLELHSPLRQLYESRLLITIIIIDNEIMCNLINYIFTELYTPTRPLKVMNSSENVVELIKTFWQKKSETDANSP